MFDSLGYELIYIQKSSPSLSDDFVFVEIFKFSTTEVINDKERYKTKYILRAEMHNNRTFAIKFYPAKFRTFEDKERGKNLIRDDLVERYNFDL